MTSIRERFGIARQLTASPTPEIRKVFGKPPVSFSADLARIMQIPRRDLDASWSPEDIAELETVLRVRGPCKCAEMRRACPTKLRRVQALALLEARKYGGLLAPIGVGHGKTLIDLLLPMVMQDCKVAVLFIPANLKSQLLDVDIPYYGAHWDLPNINGGKWFRPGKPVLHVITYNMLSRQEGTDLLERINPDTVIGDEIHNLKDPDAARTIRYLRHFLKHRKTRACDLSGTFASRTIMSYFHLAPLALGDNSPVPMHRPTAEEWSAALDPVENAAHPGALEKLCATGENVRQAFRRRRNETPGVVYTSESPCDATLVIRKRDVEAPDEILEHIATAMGGVRPDGEEFVEQLQISQCVRQLSAGFFHYWAYPHGEAEELIAEWFKRRQAFNKELRKKLQNPREFMDSPGLCIKAALRAYQDPPYDGDKPTWKASTWRDWYAIHDQVRPVTRTKWLDEFLVQDAAKWAKKHTGIIWVEFPELGERVARAAKIPYFGGGPDASAAIVCERGDRSIVASIAAHATGKNLQMFNHNLVLTPPVDGWQQLAGRTHRPGQDADEVVIDVCTHTDAYAKAFAKAREIAEFADDTDGDPQKLKRATFLGW